MSSSSVNLEIDTYHNQGFQQEYLMRVLQKGNLSFYFLTYSMNFTFELVVRSSRFEWIFG